MRKHITVLAVLAGLAWPLSPGLAQQVNPAVELPRAPTAYGPYTPYLPPDKYLTPQQSRQYLPGQPTRQGLLRQQSYQNLVGQQNRQYVPSGIRAPAEGQPQPHIAIQPFPQPIPPQTTNLGGIPQAPRALPQKPFSDYRSPPIMSPYMNLFRRDPDFDATFNYYTLVQPILNQRAFDQQQILANSQFANNLRQLQGTTAYNTRFLDAAQPLIQELPGASDYPTVQSIPGNAAAGRYLSYGNYYMNTGNYFPSYRPQGK